jgi:beta-glucosidase
MSGASVERSVAPEDGAGRSFPDGFLWGTASAAYQIEGAVSEDGRGPSIWDTFAHTPGAIEDGSTGDVACDHYHRYREDVELMAGLGLGAYRFSVCWPRVLPEGEGAINQSGLDFYDRLVDALLEHDIVPALTLYHWDLPQPLQDRGGWASRSTVDAFAHYAGVVADRLADRVPLWITHNEPWVTAFVAHARGLFPPAVRDWKVATQVAHHLLLSHGRAATVLRERGAQQVGISPNLTRVLAASERPADLAAAARAADHVNGWFLEPIFRGAYPSGLWSRLAERGLEPEVRDGDLAEIATPIDFLGVNYYMSTAVEDDPRNEGPLGYREVPWQGAVTGCGWPVTPDAFSDLLLEITRTYGPRAVYVTENGAAFDDPEPVDGIVDDPERLAFLRDHFAAALGAIDAGVPLRGYFVWTLMDNFEWTWGYRRRFGIVQVDRDTQRRTVKASGRFVERVARANALV